MASYVVLHLAIVIMVLLLSSATVQSKKSNLVSCSSSSTCSECLQSSALCAWCSSATYSRSRCDTVANIELYCMKADIQNPTTRDVYPIIDMAVQDKINNIGPIQVSPQEVLLAIRPGQPAYFNVTVRPSRDYPVDMYFVMDLSHSMNDDLETMRKVIVDLANAMRLITTDFQLGFGSFVDKTVSPFIRELYLQNQNPCIYLTSLQNDVCDKPYGFRNIFPLSQSTNMFQALLTDVTKSLSSDRPEGGLDGLMQATVCKKEIGWREEARHFIIYMSDADFHIALDGKIGKASTPNDGECHLDRNGYYTKETILDYPSIGQISSKMKKQNIIPIFAISRGQFYDDIPFYKSLVKEFFESGKVAELATDSSNIVQLVRSSYEQITSEVRMDDTAASPLKVKYTSYCGNTVTTNSRQCLSVASQESVTFELEVSVTNQNCFSGEQRFTVKPDGFNEEVLVRVETLCDCNCTPSLSASQCTYGNGTNVCGVCKCNAGRYGQDCECSLDEGSSVLNDECIADGESIACSSKGTCICGKCLCNEGLTGEFCQCSSTTCPIYEGSMCGDYGRCECNECVCEPGYTGDDCSCPPNDGCIAANGKLCNGYGTCECGLCKCSQDSAYDGPTCELCDEYTCFEALCDEKRDCIACTVNGDGSKCPNKCKQYVIFEDENYENSTYDLDSNKTCEYVNEDNCRFSFIIVTNDTATYIIINSRRYCQEKIFESIENIIFLVLGIILGILLAGLAALFIWRMLTFIYDRREYARFEKELNKSTKETGENPLFKSSTTSYKNPMYGQ
ncbi:integrin beta-6-like [Antedon mediterranea]|uniref:integrin beta-6-like n=1 Tax=Antedon mediterranea TaxID=105859 RepID=UPI003AF49173